MRYERVGRVVYPEARKGQNRGLVTAEVRALQKPMRFLKVIARNTGVCPTWHSAAGKPAWLFADEIVVR